MDKKQEQIKKYRKLLNYKRPMVDFDDKDLVIISLTIICVIAMFKITNPLILVSNIVSGLLGIATGKIIK